MCGCVLMCFYFDWFLLFDLRRLNIILLFSLSLSFSSLRNFVCIHLQLCKSRIKEWTRLLNGLGIFFSHPLISSHSHSIHLRFVFVLDNQSSSYNHLQHHHYHQSFDHYWFNWFRIWLKQVFRFLSFVLCLFRYLD